MRRAPSRPGLAIVLLLAGCAQGAGTGEAPRAAGEAPAGCRIGVLSAEGARCQAMRLDPEGRLISFFADMNGWSVGDAACVCGAPALMSPCRAGEAWEITYLGPFCPPPGGAAAPPPDAWP